MKDFDMFVNTEGCDIPPMSDDLKDALLNWSSAGAGLGAFLAHTQHHHNTLHCKSDVYLSALREQQCLGRALRKFEDRGMYHVLRHRTAVCKLEDEFDVSAHMAMILERRKRAKATEYCLDSLSMHPEVERGITIECFPPFKHGSNTVAAAIRTELNIQPDNEKEEAERILWYCGDYDWSGAATTNVKSYTPSDFDVDVKEMRLAVDRLHRKVHNSMTVAEHMLYNTSTFKPLTNV